MSLLNLFGDDADFFTGKTPESRARGAGQIAWESIPGISEAVTIKEINSELSKKNPNWGAIAMLGGAGLLGLIPFLGDIGGSAIRQGVKARRGVPINAGQKLYRYEKPNYSGSSEGAIFYTPDKSYAELYKGEDSVLKTAQTPENLLDIRLEKDREKVKPFLENEYNRLKNKSDNYEIDRVRSELNLMKQHMDRNDAQGVSGALANLDLIYMKEQGLSKLPVGMSEKRLMDNLGVDAMTIKESGRNVDEYSVVFREVPNNNAVKLNPAQQESQNIINLLKSGKANEVTDQMLAKADQRYLFENYDLPMDIESRMARAKEMGLDTSTDLYHGTTAKTDFSEFKPSEKGKIGAGVYTSKDVSKAEGYTIGHNKRIMPLFGTNNPAPEEVYKEAVAEFGSHGWGKDGIKAFNRTLGDYDGVDSKMNFAMNERTFKDPSNLRSKFARFDPRLKHLKNLSAGIPLGLLPFIDFENLLKEKEVKDD